MKIILTATSPSIDAGVDGRFGRGTYFIVIDSETLEWQAHPNPGVDALGGAGSRAAQFATEHQASVVISGDFGPNAYTALQAAGIKMYLFGANITVRQAVEQFRSDQLERVAAPTGHGRRPRG
jgi:predicted Fe-Mo cluster-binding NifX family protein